MTLSIARGRGLRIGVLDRARRAPPARSCTGRSANGSAPSSTLRTQWTSIEAGSPRPERREVQLDRVEGLGA
ncbi:MAG: hypothetical protein WCJ30_27470, partial [Deltaproteobacteria bacterium]